MCRYKPRQEAYWVEAAEFVLDDEFLEIPTTCLQCGEAGNRLVHRDQHPISIGHIQSIAQATRDTYPKPDGRCLPASIDLRESLLEDGIPATVRPFSIGVKKRPHWAVLIPSRVLTRYQSAEYLLVDITLDQFTPEPTDSDETVMLKPHTETDRLSDRSSAITVGPAPEIPPMFIAPVTDPRVETWYTFEALSPNRYRSGTSRVYPDRPLR